MDTNLGRHQMVQQGAEEVGEEGMLAAVELLLLLDAIQNLHELVLLFSLGHRNGDRPKRVSV